MVKRWLVQGLRKRAKGLGGNPTTNPCIGYLQPGGYPNTEHADIDGCHKSGHPPLQSV